MGGLSSFFEPVAAGLRTLQELIVRILLFRGPILGPPIFGNSQIGASSQESPIQHTLTPRSQISGPKFNR